MTSRLQIFNVSEGLVKRSYDITSARPASLSNRRCCFKRSLDKLGGEGSFQKPGSSRTNLLSARRLMWGCHRTPRQQIVPNNASRATAALSLFCVQLLVEVANKHSVQGRMVRVQLDLLGPDPRSEGVVGRVYDYRVTGLTEFISALVNIVSSKL